jgi:hypothetical protein
MIGQNKFPFKQSVKILIIDEEKYTNFFLFSSEQILSQYQIYFQKKSFLLINGFLFTLVKLQIDISIKIPLSVAQTL